MIAPRWKKILRDLWDHKLRTALMLLNIAVGVFAVGFVSAMFFETLVDMDADYQSANPHSALIYTDEFDSGILNTLRRVPGVGEVEGRSTYTAKASVPGGELKIIEFLSVPPDGVFNIDKILPLEEGQALTPLGKHEVWIEKSAMPALGLKPGDMLHVETLDGRTRKLKVAAYVHSVTSFPFAFTQQLTGFVTPTTMTWLGGSFYPNQVVLRVADDFKNEEHIRNVANAVTDKFEDSNRTAYLTFIYNPGRHFASDITTSLGFIMGILGGLTVAMSAFLILSTINSIVNQQIRQIGVMKAIGARTGQLVIMYLALILSFGVLGLFVGLQLSNLIGGGAGGFVATYLNFRPGPARITPQGLFLQSFVALAIPVLAAVLPVLKGTRITVREAISSYGISGGTFGKSWVDRLVEKIRALPRPLLISLRNTFRRKARLALTLSTLVVAGAIFISVFNLSESMGVAIQDTLGYVLSDVNIAFNQPYRLQKVKAIAESIPGVVEAEAWGNRSAAVLTDDELSSTQVLLYAPPAKSTFIDPTLTAGRWLQPEDENAIVIGNHLLALRPELEVGDRVTIDIDGQLNRWTIVGIYRMAGNAVFPIIYTNNEYLSRLLDEPSLAPTLRIRTELHDLISQRQIAKALQTAYDKAGIQVQLIQVGAELVQMNRSQTDVLVYFLLGMAALITLVGGLGLMSAMSLNVLERTREIGVIRAIGATDGAVQQMVIVEGLVIGLLSWLAGAILSFPLGILLANVVGVSMLQSPLDYVFSLGGFLLWLLIVVTISSVASYIPARNASRMTVREVLAYE
jgi:putative ABC transport system permease protein